MTARIRWKQRETVRKIEKRARQTTDPVERLRYVRKVMGARDPFEVLRRWPAKKIAAVVSAAIGAALLVWRIS
jgi:NaMN:DMB phosphoribosyltransferase